MTEQRAKMQVWWFPETPLGFRPLLLPESQTEWRRAHRGATSGELQSASEPTWQRGVTLRLPELPWSFALACPVRGERRPPDLAHVVPAQHKCFLRLSFCTDAAQPEPLAPEEDDIGLMSLLAEYVELLVNVFATLQLSPDSIEPATSGLILELPTLPKTPMAAAAPGAGEAHDRVARILLGLATADWLARGRGFRLAAAQCRGQPGEWHAFDGSWLCCAAQAL